MKWYAISGSWRTINKQVKEDVESIVKRIIREGDGIITGGALGVDFIATETVIQNGNPKEQLKIFLPIKLEVFCKHYLKRADEGVITKEQAERIIKQLNYVKKLAPASIIDETKWKEANVESYYGRNLFIIEACNELYAFQVNESQGTQDAIDKAKELGKRRHIKKYTIKNEN